MSAGRIVQTDVIEAPQSLGLPAEGPWVGWLKHERIECISYPYEWSFGMLRDAALLTLDLMLSALDDDVILKDATPYNVQFRGTRPVFIDVASLVPHNGGPWEGYQQFCQMFLFPLMLQAWQGVDFQPFLRGRLNGISPQECWRLLSGRHIWRKGVFSHVFLHAQLAGGVTESHTGVPESMRASGFQKSLVQANVTRLRKIVGNLQWKAKSSRWADYDTASSPVASDGAAKEAFVERILGTRRWGQVWDLGANVGRYSRIASRHARYVLALDIDHLAVDRMYTRLREEESERILPLVFNLADPSPGLGWRQSERTPLPQRSRPDLILCLALIHHLVLHENLLLPDVVNWLADLGAALIIEFVDKTDPQARSLLANRRDQYTDYSLEAFRQILTSRFRIREEVPLPSGTRTLYFVEPHSKRDPSQGGVEPNEHPQGE